MARSVPEHSGAESEQIEAVEREIERYLRAHPNASDTLEGVRDWWLAGLAGPLSVEVVQTALDRLVEERALEARSIPGGVVYGRVKYQDGEATTREDA